MDGKNLVFELRKPFDMFVKNEDHPVWLGMVSQIRTKYPSEIRFFREIVESSHVNNLILKVAYNVWLAV